MPANATSVTDPPGTPEVKLIRNFGYRSSSSSSSNSSNYGSKCNNNVNNNNNNGTKKKHKNRSDSSNNNKSGSTSSTSTSSSGSDSKNVLGCGGKKDYRRRIVVDLTWRRGKVGDKVTREYQRF